jgi:hypothetical protein
MREHNGASKFKAKTGKGEGRRKGRRKEASPNSDSLHRGRIRGMGHGPKKFTACVKIPDAIRLEQVQVDKTDDKRIQRI